ncbi:hypothetical protein Tco_1053148 [Tanacetum coccineum]
MEMETKTKPEYKKDKVVAVTSFSGNMMHSPNYYSEMNHEEREETLKSAIGCVGWFALIMERIKIRNAKLEEIDIF